jgi:prepilin-type N-terminal cleavage/methylation domain-containing protein
MQARSRRQDGFSLVESLVAMVLVVIGALALAAILAGGAAINSRVTDRQKALALAEQQIDKLRSYSYAELGMAPLNGAGLDPGRAQVDWRTTFCPMPSSGNCGDFTSNATNDPNGGRMITLTPNLVYSALKTANDPRQAKLPQYGAIAASPATTASSVVSNGMIAYTYVYWPYDQAAGRVRKDWKVITVVVRFRDPANSTAGDRNFGTVKMSSVVVDNPGLGQIPEVDTLACSDGIDNDSDSLIDTADPQCHTDGNAGNNGSYQPNLNSES